MANDSGELHAGFTGSPVEKSDGIRQKARDATALVKSEARAVGSGVIDHPHTASTLLLGVSALAFGLGYLMGRSSAPSRSSYWR
jgi:hypothetical protein